VKTKRTGWAEICIAIIAVARHPEHLSARHYRQTMNRVGTPNNQSKNGVPDIMVGNPLAISRAEQQWALRTEHDLLQRIERVLRTHLVLVTSC